ncbi:GNAT family N-acetyltransferase [Nitrospira lenta]|uniref:N-acetyltransferase, GNAT family n=1 Tax=Nitrospira lenta TaxID=1436998 RepID=A0A330LAU6_9BACT|nr:GNAT family N-acetyltransferase [Nitrospira lenta]SPP64086.1 N-acetyltransferase, GNAT family [Nitrospira lenta]
MTIPQDWTIRSGRLDDIERLVAFSQAMALETEGRRLEADRLQRGTRALLNSTTHGFFLVAEQPLTSQVVGQLMITYEWSDWRNASFWWIQSVYVAPAWRRKGVFRKMHAKVIEQAKADPGVCGVRLYVESKNSVAQDVYRRVGLKPSSYSVFETDFVLGHAHSLQDRPDEA